MNKIILAILIIASCVFPAYADEGEQAVEKAPAPSEELYADRPDAQAQEETEPVRVVRDVTLRTGAEGFVTGRVDKVVPADVLTRPKAKIFMTDNSGEPCEFTIKALAVIYDANGRFLSLNDVQPGQEVQINYIKLADKSNEAAAIKVIE